MLIAKPRRRWFQFSLRSLLMLVTLCAVALGSIGSRVYTARLRLGYYKLSDEGLMNPTGLTNVRELSVCSEVTDPGLEHLQRLARLETLTLDNCRRLASVAPLSRVEWFHALRILHLAPTEITD